jgi:hypothetical protein
MEGGRERKGLKWKLGSVISCCAKIRNGEARVAERFLRKSWPADPQNNFSEIFEVFTAMTMKGAVSWDVMPCGSFKN